MKELEEHLRAMTEQVKFRRKLLKNYTSNQRPFEDGLKQASQSDVEIHQAIANKRRIEVKLEEEIEQYQMKIDRADQLVC